MNTLSKEQVGETLSVIIRKALVAGENVEVPGLGSFALHHQPSTAEKTADGLLELKPPKDEVVFTPAQQ